MTGAVCVPLMRRRAVAGYATIDAADAERVAAHRWTLLNGYAVTRVEYRTVYMHRFVLGLSPGEMFVHHIDEDKLNNRRDNLVACETASEAAAQPHPKRAAHTKRLLARAAA